MIPLAEARAHVLDRVPRLAPRAVPLADALGCVTAEPVHATDPVPPFDNTAMDGFAVRSAETTGATDASPRRLEVVATLAAGSAEQPEVGPGQAVRIMTGAPLPPGADAVVMVERTEAADGVVDVLVEVPPGNHVRRAGEDLGAGDEVVGAGTVLTGALVGVLASVGRREVVVRPRPRVGVLSTGDELVAAPAPLGRGQIRDSNRPMLLAEVAAGGFDPVDLGSHPDDDARLTEAIRGAAATCDAVLTSGGVSVGDFDLVKAVLDREGDMAWMQVAIRPAKPFAFGLVGGTPVFGLPGNPVSALVSFELFARPGLRTMMGHPRPDRSRLRAVADEGLPRHPDGKTHFARVRAVHGDDGRYHVLSAGGQGSHQLSAMAAANALAVIPDGTGPLAGEDVELIALEEIPAAG